MGILFAFLSAFLFATSVIIGKISVDRTKSPVAVATLFQIFAGVASIGFFLFEAPRVIESSLTSWGLLIAACIAYAVFSIYGFKANKLLEISVSAIFAQISLLFVFFASALLFREEMTVLKLLGILLLVSGNVYLVGSAWKKRSISKQGLIYRIIAALALSVGVLIDAANSANFSPGLYGFLAYFVAGVFTWLIGRVSWGELKEELRSNWKQQVIMGLFAATGYYLFISAFALAPKIVVVPVNNLNTIIVVLLGILLLKETSNLKRKLLAAALAFAGALLLTL